MTQSKKPDFESTINIEELDLSGLLDDDTTTINIDNLFTDTIDLSNIDSATTTYWAGDSVTDIVLTDSNISNGTFTIDTSTLDDGVGLDWIYERHSLSISEVEKMCNEYPALEKTWRNFKSMYDMVKQDYQGKKDAGEIDDDIPF